MARSKRKSDPEQDLIDALSQIGEGTVGQIRIDAGADFSARTRLRVRGLNVEAEKEKVSLTLNRDLIEVLRSSAGPKRLSATVNELLIQAVERAQLRSLVDALEEEKGPASAESYQELLDEWFGETE